MGFHWSLADSRGHAYRVGWVGTGACEVLYGMVSTEHEVYLYSVDIPTYPSSGPLRQDAACGECLFAYLRPSSVP